MASRKDQLKNMFQPLDTAPKDGAPARSASGAVKAMGLSLGGLQREIEEARNFGVGERIVEIDVSLIDPSPYADRLSDGADGDEEFVALVESLRLNGQQVPVLLRPHAVKVGRYESAFGHRRIKAARQLNIPIKAIIRPLTDAALLLAQGKENAERRNLSFIEKALFVKNMMDAGVDRAAAQEAISVHKTEMTRFIQVADAIPLHIARAIGPAPKTGRPRWMALGELLAMDAARIKADDEITSDGFRDFDSDRRFQMVFARISRKPEVKDGATVIKAAGLNITVTGTRFDVGDLGFASWLTAVLPELAAKFEAERS
jgi:ParB family transcriptional regulator, chromosome partitioning protein